MANIPITRIRYPESEARELLKFFVFGSRHRSLRPPRGIDPEYVSWFLLSTLTADTPALYCQRALEAMRFYEIRDLSAHLQRILVERAPQDNEIQRSAFLLQALGDLGTAAEGAWAADYFDRILLQMAGFAEAAEVLLKTLLALVPFGSPDEFVKRLQTEIGSAQTTQTRGRLRELADNRLPGLAYLSEGKRRLLDTPAEQRRAELVSIYLMESDLGEPYMVTWAARMIRSEAMANDPAGIYAEFGSAIDSQAEARVSDSDAAFTIVGAAQAIVYLQGALTPAWRALYNAFHHEEFLNFLWDDDPI